MTKAALGIAALLVFGGTSAAFAALEHVGSVVLTTGTPGQSEYRNFYGNELTLTARNADLNCDSVVATFDSGRSRGVFAGALPRGRTVAVGLPEGEGRVLRMDFHCRPTSGLGGVIDIAGGTDRLFSDRSAAQIAEAMPQRGGWREFFARLF